MAIQSTPKRYTYEELAAMPDDGKRYELVDGELYMTPGPLGPHQIIGFNVARAFRDAIDQPTDGLVLQEFDVRFTRHKAVRPDVVFLAAANMHRYFKTGIDGPPDLVVEVLSPGGERHDLVRKYTWYEEYGVPEYWVVFSDRRRVEIYRQQPGSGYGAPLVAEGMDPLRSPILPQLTVTVADLYLGLPEEQA